MTSEMAKQSVRHNQGGVSGPEVRRGWSIKCFQCILSHRVLGASRGQHSASKVISFFLCSVFSLISFYSEQEPGTQDLSPARCRGRAEVRAFLRRGPGRSSGRGGWGRAPGVGEDPVWSEARWDGPWGSSILCLARDKTNACFSLITPGSPRAVPVSMTQGQVDLLVMIKTSHGIECVRFLRKLVS